MEINSIHPFIDYLEKIRHRTLRLINVVPEAYFDWSYKPNKFSIGDQIRHIATIERFMFVEIAAGRPSAYKGCGKDLADGFDQTMVLFNTLHQESLEILRNFTDADLQKKIITFDNAQMTLWKWLRAMTEHEIHHRAELYLYLNILDVKTPPIFGFTAEEVEVKSIIH